MFELLTHLVPYPDLQNGKITEYKFYRKVINENYRPTFKFPIEAGLEHLIKRCWSKNIETRPTFKEIFELLSTNEDYFLSNVDRDELESYVDELNNSTQKVDTEKVITSALQKSSTRKEIDELKKKINELEKQNAQIMEAMKHQDEIIKQQKEIIFSFQEKIAEETEKRQQFEQNMNRMQQQQREIIFSFQEKITKETEKRQQLEQDMNRMQKRNEELLNDIMQRINEVHVTQEPSHEDSSHMHSEEEENKNGKEEEKETVNDYKPNKEEEINLTVFVRNIPYEATAEQLGDFFNENFGEIKDVRILKKTFFGKQYSRGMGFVEFKDVESCQKALCMQNIVFQEKHLVIIKTRLKKQLAFIKGVPAGTTEEDIRNLLRDFNPEQVKIVKYDNDQSLGFCYVQFASPEDLKNVLTNHETIQINGKESRLFRSRTNLYGQGERRRRYRGRRRFGRRRVPKSNTSIEEDKNKEEEEENKENFFTELI